MLHNVHFRISIHVDLCVCVRMQSCRGNESKLYNNNYIHMGVGKRGI